MIPGDQGEGVGVPASKHWRGGLPTRHGIRSRGIHSYKKTRKNGAPSSPRVAADVAADVVVEIAPLPGTEDA
jgi:hypothetical protein